MSELSPIPLSFPPTVKFGIADADLQVIGENNTIKYEKSDPTMWSHFALTSGKCYQNQTPGLGIDRYHRWKKDIEIMRKIGVRHYRTSISMSRILKQDGKINSKAIEWYTQYFKALKKAGYGEINEFIDYLSHNINYSSKSPSFISVNNAKVITPKVSEMLTYSLLELYWSKNP